METVAEKPIVTEESDYSEQYPHLLKKTAALLEAKFQEKAKYIKSDKFIPTEDSIPALRTMVDLVEMPSVIRQEGVALSGETSTGKSALLREFKNLAKGISDFAGKRVPVADVTMPVSCNEQRLNFAIVRSLGAGVGFNPKTTGLGTHVVQNHLSLCGTRCIIIQEANNLAEASAVDQRRVCDSIKNIMHDHGIVVILSGTPEFLDILQRRENEQLGNRLLSFELTHIQNLEKIQSFLATLEGYFPFTEPSDFHVDAVVECIANASSGVIGKIVSIVTEAAYQALLDEKKSIPFDYIKKATKIRYVASRVRGYIPEKADL